MKQPGISSQAFNIRRFTASSFAVVLLLALFFVRFVHAEVGDPRLSYMEPVKVGVTEEGGKKKPFATFKIMATTSNGTGYVVKGSSTLYLQITNLASGDTRRLALGSDGGGTLTFTDLYPSVNYNVSVIAREPKGLQYVERALDAPSLFRITTTDGDSPVIARSTFTFAKNPEFFNNDKSVRFFLRSSVSHDSYQLSLRNVVGDYYVNKPATFIHAYQSEADVKEIVFDNLLPGVIYTPSVSMTLPHGSVPAKIQDLPGFTSPGVAPPPPVPTYSYKLVGKPLISVVDQGAGPNNINVELTIVSPTTQSGISVVTTPAVGGPSGKSDLSFVANVPQKVTIEALFPNALYAITVYKFENGKMYANTVNLGKFNTPGKDTLLEKSEVPIIPYVDSSTSGDATTPVGIPRVTTTGPTGQLGTTCTDGIDNDGDGRIDYYGTATAEPDPSCYAIDAEEIADSVAAGSLVPCTDKCGFSDVFKLLNNVLNFILTVLLLPIFVILLMYIGFKYLTAQGKPGVHLKFKKMLWHMFIGVVIILSAWLIVRSLLSALGYTDGLQFFE